MDSDSPLDYAQFQLSPRRSHCELFICGDGKTEKIASGLVKPFVTHLKVAEEQFAQTTRFIKLQVESPGKARTWFKKGTLERFVRFVSTPEVLEIVHNFDSEMSQLEGARRIYSQGAEDQLSQTTGEGENLASASGDITKKELLRAIDVRLGALKQDLTMAYARASAAGFTLGTISELLPFADHFGARRLSEACERFSLFCQRHPELATQHNHHHQQQQNQQIMRSVVAPGGPDIRASSDSDMSLDCPDDNTNVSTNLTATVSNMDKKPSCTYNSSQQQMTKSSVGQCSVEGVGNDAGESKQFNDSERIAPSTTARPAGGSRRLSVQDRINIFESKQKEQAGSTQVLSGTSGGGAGGRIGGRPELRRLSSDISSSVEKSVLRRWSGTSDMSFDNDSGNSNPNRKDHGSTATIFSDSFSRSLSSSGIQTGSRNEERDTATSQSTINPEEACPLPMSQWKFRSSKDADQAKDSSVKDGIGQGRQSILLQEKDQVHQPDKESIQQISEVLQQSQCTSSSDIPSGTGLSEKRTAQTSSIPVSTRVKPIEPKAEAKSRATKLAMLKAKEGATAMRASQVLSKSNNVVLEDTDTCIVPLHDFPNNEMKGAKIGDFSSRDINIPKVSSNPNSSMGFQNDRDESSASLQSLALPASRVNIEPSIDACDSFGSSDEPLQITRPMKGNQELNNVLQSKADELEKVFAEHMLRVPGDLPSTKRGKPLVRDNHSTLTEKGPQEDIFHQHSGSSEYVSNATEFDPKIFDIVDRFELHPITAFGDPKFSENFRGKFYKEYARKRDTKLREEWRSTGASKEAKMKAMQDMLEQSRVEMRSKFSGSADRKNSPILVQRRAEKLRSYSASSAMKIKKQAFFFSTFSPKDTHLMREVKTWEHSKSIQHMQVRKEGEELEDPMEHISSGFMETANDSSSRIATSRKNLSSRSMCSTPRNSSINDNPTTMESATISSGRRRIPSDNSLVQSVPNFSDFRKENKKPLSGTGKMSRRVHSRSSTRSKGSGGTAATLNEDRPQRSQSMRKGSASPVELSDLSSVNSDNLMMELTDQSLNQKSQESKPFLRKGKGIGPGSGAVVAKKKASMHSQKINSEGDCVGPVEPLSNIVKEEEGSRMLTSEAVSRVDNDSRLSADSMHSEDLESENGETSELQDDPSSPFAVPSSALKGPGEVVQDSPEESPGSWNSRIHHSFSYVQEASDVDASMDSPIGSPASWSSHPLNQVVDSDAAPMRRKWGAAQKPMFINSSLGQPRRDVTKGFKRLLKFGRKNKGQDALLPDWVSASTNSEGDDDAEDSHDPGNHMSDDMPKSRMGFPQHQSAYDGFHDDGLFSDEGHSLGTPVNFKLREDSLSGSSLKAPRSFFSLSTFRSKGSESKLR